MPRALRAAACALPGVLLLAVAWASHGGRVIDDAYISLTYARQVALGHGPVFHPDLPRTEGFSNPLWTLILALPCAMGLGGAWAAEALAWACAAAALAIVCVKVGGWNGAAVGVALAGSPIYGYWAGQGLEGSLGALLLVAGVVSLGSPWAALWFGLLGAHRPEGLAWGAVPLAWHVLQRRFPPWLLLVPVPGLAWLTFRLSFFGHWLPATYYAKVHEGTARYGLAWLAGAPFAEPVLIAALLGAVASLAARRVRPGGHEIAAVACVLLTAAYGVWAGGDWMPSLRWLQPALPLAWFAVARGLKPAWIAALAALVSAAYGSHVDYLNGTSVAWRRDMGLGAVPGVVTRGPHRPDVSPLVLFALEELSPKDALLLPDLGAVAWSTGQPVLDPQGLAWWDAAVLLHGRDAEWDKGVERVRETVHALHPAVVELALGRGGAPPLGPVANALLDDKGKPGPDWFRKGWLRWMDMPYGPDGGMVLSVWLRRDLGPEPDAESRIARYRDALSRAPEFDVIRSRLAQALWDQGLQDEARAEAERVDWGRMVPPPPEGWWAVPPGMRRRR